MGRNFYFVDMDNKQYHIGKSSYGWMFTFQCQTQLDVFSKNQWQKYLEVKQEERDYIIGSKCIVDEYGEFHDVHVFFEEVVDTKARLKNYKPEKLPSLDSLGDYYDREGYPFYLGDFG